MNKLLTLLIVGFLLLTACDTDQPSNDEQLATISVRPNFAFDAIMAIMARSMGNMFRDVDGQIKKYFEGIPFVPATDSYYKFLLEHYSLEEVEKMDLNTLANVFPDTLRTNEFIDDKSLANTKEGFIKGFEILKEMDFTNLWKEHCLPFLIRQSEATEAALKNDSTTERVLRLNSLF